MQAGIGRRYKMPLSSVEVLTPPAEEPVTLAEVKSYIKVDFNDDDDLINLMIKASRQQIEEYCKRSFVTQTLRYNLDLPYENWIYRDYNRYWQWFFEKNVIYLSKPEIQSVSSIVFYGSDDQPETVDPSAYELDIPGYRVFLKDNQLWPYDVRQIKSMSVEYVAGYGDASAVPAPIKMAILSHVLSMYDGRTLCAMPEQTKKHLSSPYKIYNRLATNERL